MCGTWKGRIQEGRLTKEGRICYTRNYFRISTDRGAGEFTHHHPNLRIVSDKTNMTFIFSFFIAYSPPRPRDLLLYFSKYSIYRPSDCPVGRPWAKIRTRDGRSRGRDTNTPPHRTPLPQWTITAHIRRPLKDCNTSIC